MPHSGKRRNVGHGRQPGRIKRDAAFESESSSLCAFGRTLAAKKTSWIIALVVAALWKKTRNYRHITFSRYPNQKVETYITPIHL